MWWTKAAKETDVKIVFLDVDGVMTDGKKTYDRRGFVVEKQFCDQDFTAIKRFVSRGIPVYLVSGDNSVTEEMCRRRGLNFAYTMDKIPVMEAICDKHGCSLADAVYVGDDWYDDPILRSVGYPFKVRDGEWEVGQYIAYLLDSKGGEKAIAEVFRILKNRGHIRKEDGDVER